MAITRGLFYFPSATSFAHESSETPLTLSPEGSGILDKSFRQKFRPPLGFKNPSPWRRPDPYTQICSAASPSALKLLRLMVRVKITSPFGRTGRRLAVCGVARRLQPQEGDAPSSRGSTELTVEVLASDQTALPPNGQLIFARTLSPSKAISRRFLTSVPEHQRGPSEWVRRPWRPTKRALYGRLRNGVGHA